MKHRLNISTILMFILAVSVLGGCDSLRPVETSSQTTNELIQSLHHERIEQLYYESYPHNVKELMVRQKIVPELIGAYYQGGDDLYRFNLIVILNHRSALSDLDRMAIVTCLERALKDSSAWVRTEAVWGLGISGSVQLVPSIVPLLDDPDPNVVNETILSLAKLTGTGNLPISNNQMSKQDRDRAVEFWKGWWTEMKSKQI